VTHPGVPATRRPDIGVYRNRLPENIVAIVLAAALMAAPFLALLYSPAAGLGVMAIALGASVSLLLEVRDAAPVRVRRRLGFVVGLDVVLALACAAAAVWWLTAR
jgi:hypothetical protein